MKQLFKQLPCTNAFFSKLLFIFLLLFPPFFAHTQIDENESLSCKEGEVSFQGIPASTLCEDLGTEFDIEIGEGTSITHSSQIGSSLADMRVYISGDFQVDELFIFQNCIVRIAPGVTINVRNNQPPQIPWPALEYAFILDNSKLFACDGLWQGIVLTENTLLTSINGTEIEDASSAIFANNVFCGIILENTTFDRNNIGLHMSASFSNSAFDKPLLLRMAACTFSCSAPLNGTEDQVSLAGIFSQNVPLSINVPTEISGSMFENLQYGIRALGNSPVSLNYGEFNNTFIAGIYSAMGVVDVKNTVFYNCERRSIRVVTCTNVNLQTCEFNYDHEIMGFPSALSVEGLAPGSKMLVSNCDFNSYLAFGQVAASVEILNGVTGSGSDIEIRGCDFNMVGSVTGIYLLGNYTPDSYININNNQFSFLKTTLFGSGGSPFGLRIENGDKHNMTIRTNNFFTPNNASLAQWHGFPITLQGSNGVNNEVMDNIFPGPVPIEFGEPLAIESFINAITVNEFKNTTFCSNYIFNSNRCFSFTGQNNDTDLYANTCTGGQLLSINGSASWIDLQDQKGNTWQAVQISPILWAGATPQAHLEATDLSAFSEFIVHTEQSISILPDELDIYHPPVIIPDEEDEWWRMETGVPQDPCAELTPAPVADEGASVLRNTVVSGLIGNYLTAPTSIWQAERGVYRSLSNAYQNPGIPVPPAQESFFLQQFANNEIGRLQEVENQIVAAIRLDNQMAASMQDQQQETEEALAALALIDTAYDLLNQSELISSFAEKQGALDRLMQASGNVANFQELHRESAISGLEIARMANEQIQAQTTTGTIETTVTGMYIKHLTSGVLDSNDIALLLPIAEMCPADGGMAVYQARAILPYCLTDHISDDYEDCYPIPGPAEVVTYEVDKNKMLYVPQLTTPSTAILYPNPAQDKVIIRIPDAEAEAVVLTIRNSTGQLVRRQEGGMMQTIDLTAIPAGVYYVEISINGQIAQKEKLIVH